MTQREEERTNMHDVGGYLNDSLKTAEERLRDAHADLEDAKKRLIDAESRHDRTLKWRDELHAFILKHQHEFIS
jgi:hypothetical protein